MKILFVSLSPFDSVYSCSIRNRALVKGILSLGHEVTYLTVANTTGLSRSAEFESCGNLNILELNSKKKEKYDSIKSNLIRKLGRSPRLIYHKLFLYELVRYACKDFGVEQLGQCHYDILISSSDPKASHYLAKRLVQQGLRYNYWIQYWGDPFAFDITRHSFYPRWYIRWVEKGLLQLADKVVYTSPFTLKEQRVVFPNEASKMISQPTPYEVAKIYPNSCRSTFVVGYHGYYMKRIRNIEPLLLACKQLSSKLHLEVVGNGNYNIEDSDNISIHQAVGDIEVYEDRADILVVLMNRTGTQIPGKLYHIAGTNKAILVILDGENQDEMRVYIESFGRYYTCGNSVSEIREALMRIISENRSFGPAISLTPMALARNFLEAIEHT